MVQGSRVGYKLELWEIMYQKYVKFDLCFHAWRTLHSTTTLIDSKNIGLLVLNGYVRCDKLGFSLIMVQLTTVAVNISPYNVSHLRMNPDYFHY